MRIIGTANSIVSQKNRSRMWIPGMHGTGPGRGWPFLVDTSIYGGRGDKGRWPRRKRFLKARSCHQYTKIAQHCQTYNNFWFYGFWGAHCTRTACKFLADKAFFFQMSKSQKFFHIFVLKEGSDPEIGLHRNVVWQRTFSFSCQNLLIAISKSSPL